MAGVGVDTKIYPKQHLDQSAFHYEEGGASMSTQKYHRASTDYYQVQESLTLDEVRYSDIRKKIPGMGRVPNFKSRVQHEADLTEWNQRKQDHVTYVKQHFHQIECCKFVPKPKQDVKKIRDLKCHCGEVLSEHSGLANSSPMNNVQRDILEAYLIPEPLRSVINRETHFKPVPAVLPQVEWSKETAFRENVTTTFGKINFVNVEQYGGSKPAKYIRLSNKDSIENLTELMDKHWKIMEPKPPSLCISVIGGAKNFKLDGKMSETFNTGLVRAAKTTNAWLITSGFNVGVMKAVGQAVSEGQSFVWEKDRITHMLRCIGIGPWGYVRNRKFLECTDNTGNGRFPANFKTSNVIIHGQPVPLNPNHTHFVFVDDGIRNHYAGASEFRAKFEEKVSKPIDEGGLGIPVVLLILEGGTDAIKDAKTSLEHKIPVVVCAGTGRAADILAYGYSHTKKNKGQMKPKYLDKLKEKIYDSYGERWKDDEVDKNIESNLKNVKDCMAHRELISIFNMNKHEELDIAILSALLKSKTAQKTEESRLTQLKLALTWNRSDIAQEEIFREDVLWPTGSLNGILLEAILEDRVEFVQLILQQNVVMREFLTRERLQELYEKALERPDSVHLPKLFMKITGKKIFSFLTLDQLLDKFMDKFDEDCEKPDSDEIRQYGTLEANPDTYIYRFPYKQLLIWSILTLKTNVARFFWEMGSEPVTSAIAASRLLHSMSLNMNRNEIALKHKIDEYKAMFEKLATDVLDHCHLKHNEKAMMLAERRSPTWSNMTSMQMAASAGNRKYLSSTACQNSTDTIWKRGITSSWLKVLLTMFFPFLIVTRFIEMNPLGEEKVTWRQKIFTFYTAPICKFGYNALAYIVFVILFSYFILVDFKRDIVTPVECVCIGWIFSFMIDDVYTLLMFPSPTFKGKLRDWYGPLKFFDFLNFAMGVVAFIVHASKGSQYAEEAKVMYCLNGIIFYVKTVKFYSTNTKLGPKLVMIKMMVEELKMFFLVLVIFLLAYGVASQALLFTEREPSWQILKDVLYYPYWQLYGELFLEEIENEPSEDCIAVNARGFDCRTSHWLVYFLLAGYLIIGNILLFNLLIAIFNYIFSMIQENSFEIWKFQFYFVTMEYENKTTFVPPLSIIPEIYYGIKWLARKTCCRKKYKGVQFTKRHLEFLQLFEKEEMANFIRTEKLHKKETSESKLQKRVEELFKLVEEELTADHTSNFMETIAPKTEILREDTCEIPLIGTNGWPTPTAVITKGDQDPKTDDVQEEDKEGGNKKKKKKHKKEKKKKKEKQEEKIMNIDFQTEAKPSSKSVKLIPTEGFSSQGNTNVGFLHDEDQELSNSENWTSPPKTPEPKPKSFDSAYSKPPRSRFLQRKLTPEILRMQSDDSEDSEEDNKGVVTPRNTLSKKYSKNLYPRQSDSDSDIPHRRIFKKSRDSSTEEERGHKKWKQRRRRRSDSD